MKEVVVTDVEEVHGHVGETTLVSEERRTQEVVAHGQIDGVTEVITTSVVVKDHGWGGMFNHKMYGKDHHYYHMDPEIMVHMDYVHLEDPKMAHKLSLIHI